MEPPSLEPRSAVPTMLTLQVPSLEALPTKATISAKPRFIWCAHAVGHFVDHNLDAVPVHMHGCGHVVMHLLRTSVDALVAGIHVLCSCLAAYGLGMYLCGCCASVFI